jgi:predicted Zn-dependent peptidase
MDNVVLDDIRGHYLLTHSASNMRFVIAGKLPPKRQKILSELFETIELWAGNGRSTLPHEVPKALMAPLYIHNESVENLYFYIDTFMHRRMEDAEADALSLINTMLTETLYSRILGTARERGLVYGMSSGFGQTKDSSNWWFGAQVMPKNAPKLFKIIVKELSDVFSGNLAEDDISMAKQYALGRFQRSGQTVSGTAAGYSGRYFFDDHIDDYYKIPERIEAVTKDSIVTIARQLFEDKTWGMGCLGSSGEVFAKNLQREILPLWEK